MSTAKQRKFECLISECNKVSENVYLVILEAPKDEFFEFQPGQFLYIHMDDEDARPYSIASTPVNDSTITIHIQDMPDNVFSAQVLSKLINDTSITIRSPAGRCTIDRSNGTRPLLFIAGGTGFAPCHSIIQSLIESDDSRSIQLYWGANHEAEFYLRETPELWAKNHANFTFIPVIAQLNDQWSGETGLVHEAVFRNIGQLPDYDIFLSGSSDMVFNIYRQLRSKGVPSNQIFSDMLDILRDDN
jgi:CDP-4-dehydro-6-deoxyglucose reductase